MSEVTSFDEYWEREGIKFAGPKVMELAFREIAEKAFNAGRKAENARRIEDYRVSAELGKCN